jgi:hypothetical protein
MCQGSHLMDCIHPSCVISLQPAWRTIENQIVPCLHQTCRIKRLLSPSASALTSPAPPRLSQP